MSRRMYAGGAQPTTLSAPMTNADTSMTVVSGTNYPDGSTGKAVLTLDAGLAGEEKVLYTARTGNTFSGLTRGYDGTVAVSHSSGASVRHTISAVDLDEANAHVNNTTGDPHPQYLTGFSPSYAVVATSQTSTSTTYTDLATVGPAVTVTIKASGLALVTLSAAMVNDTAGIETWMHVAVSGATTRVAGNNDAENYSFNADVANAVFRGSRTFIMFGLTPGVTTFTAKYRVGGASTGTWAGRQIIVTAI